MALRTKWFGAPEGVKQYELSNEQWRRIEDLLPGKKGDPGRSGRDNRLFVNAVLWVLRSSARWSDLPERYGTRKAAYKRFTRWAEKGVWERVFASLTGDSDNLYLMLDATRGSSPTVPSIATPLAQTD